LISTSQKVRVRLSFERVHDDQTEKDGSHGRSSEAATSAGRAEGRATAIIRCRRNHVETDADRLCPCFDRRAEPALQRDALTEAGCAKIFTEQMSGAVTDRPALHDALEFARSGDTLIVWKLDRLARSMKQLIETVETRG
jgi:Resolvase, N terminal domain